MIFGSLSLAPSLRMHDGRGMIRLLTIYLSYLSRTGIRDVTFLDLRAKSHCGAPRVCCEGRLNGTSTLRRRGILQLSSLTRLPPFASCQFLVHSELRRKQERSLGCVELRKFFSGTTH
jgi:hypothetical protein